MLVYLGALDAALSGTITFDLIMKMDKVYIVFLVIIVGISTIYVHGKNLIFIWEAIVGFFNN